MFTYKWDARLQNSTSFEVLIFEGQVVSMPYNLIIFKQLAVAPWCATYCLQVCDRSLDEGNLLIRSSGDVNLSLAVLVALLFVFFLNWWCAFIILVPCPCVVSWKRLKIIALPVWPFSLRVGTQWEKQGRSGLEVLCVSSWVPWGSD